MRKTIGGREFAEMILCCSAALDEHRQQLNDLNVFPVPDGDTGTNMSMTMASAAQALRENAPPAVGEAANKAASALLRGARGNSGVIMSLLFRGMAKSLKGKTDCTAAEWSKAMSDGVDAAYKAVMKRSPPFTSVAQSFPPLSRAVWRISKTSFPARWKRRGKPLPRPWR